MQAAIYKDFQQPLELTDVDDPIPGDHGVVLEVKCTGLCLSDWHGWMGHDPDISLPHIPGHEMAGVIAEVGKSVTCWKPGDRVTLPFVCGCGHCAYCIEGNPQICDHQFQPGFTHWGSFAPYVAINYAENNLVRIPDFLDFKSAAILGCRFATSFRAVVDQGKLRRGQWVAVHGCGGVGLSAVMIARAFDARIIAIDLDERPLQFARELGAECTIQASDTVSEQIQEVSHGGVHISIDAVGRPDIVNNSVACLRKGGRHLQVGLMEPEETDISLPFEVITARELKIMGSHGIQAGRYGAMLQLIEKGRLDPGRLITKTISLKDALTDLIRLKDKKDPGITVIDTFTGT